MCVCKKNRERTHDVIYSVDKQEKWETMSEVQGRNQ